MATPVETDSIQARRAAVARYLAEEGERDRALEREPGRVTWSGVGPSGRGTVFIRKGKKMINQDAAVLWENFGGRRDATLLAVMDGHGVMGERVSTRARDSLPSILLGALRGTRGVQAPMEPQVSRSWSGTEGMQHSVSDPSFRQWEGEAPGPTSAPGGAHLAPGIGPQSAAPPGHRTAGPPPLALAGEESEDSHSFSLAPPGKAEESTGESIDSARGGANKEVPRRESVGVEVTEEMLEQSGKSEKGRGGEGEGGDSQPGGCLPLRNLSRRLRMQRKPVYPESESKKALHPLLAPQNGSSLSLAHAMLTRSDWDGAFEACNREIRLHPGISALYSGSTVVLALLQGTRLTVAHIGDSRAVLGVRGPSGSLRPIQLTRDHKAMDLGEKERVEREGGRVFADPREPQTLRVWLPGENIPGLAVTRALGNEVLKGYGVCHTPDVLQVDLDDSAEVLILASDGVWDKVSNEEALQEAAVEASAACRGKWFESRETAAKRIADLATSRWGYKTRDDISVIVVRLGGDEDDVLQCM